MTKQNTITWIILLALTVFAGFVSKTSVAYLVPILFLLTILKFIGVAFNFMEMRKANSFWKVLILGYLILFCFAVIAV